MLSVHHAAERLGVSDRRVRALIDSGRLRAQRLGRAWVIDPSALRSVEGERAPGRPLSLASAWSELLGDRDAPAADAPILRSRYRRRSARFELDGPDLDSVVDLTYVRQGGWAAALRFDNLVDEDPSAPIVVYVGERSYDAWCERHWLISSSVCRVVAHVVSDGIAQALCGRSDRYVPPRVAAVDLAESGGARSIEAALRIWNV